MTKEDYDDVCGEQKRLRKCVPGSSKSAKDA